MKITAWLIATWFGCGKWPWGPGTAGSIGALIAAAGFVWLGLAQPWHLAVFALLCTPLAIWASTAMARSEGREDPQMVVVDEVLGFRVDCNV